VKIEDDIPIPPIKGRPRTEFGRLLRSLKIGQSVLCDSEAQKDVARNVIIVNGGKYTTRKVDGGWRVWRVG
jgi:hypothetical protein